MNTKSTRLEKKLREDMRYAIDLIFGVFARPKEAHGKMLERMAGASTLCLSTVERLYYGYSQFPRFLTLQKLAAAAKLAVLVGDDAVRLSLAKKQKVAT